MVLISNVRVEQKNFLFTMVKCVFHRVYSVDKSNHPKVPLAEVPIMEMNSCRKVYSV